RKGLAPGEKHPEIMAALAMAEPIALPAADEPGSAEFDDNEDDSVYDPNDQLPDAWRYNTTLGTSLDLTGPFDFPNTTLRVLPLLANEDSLNRFLQKYLNKELAPAGQRFEAWGRYVYLVATSYEEMASDSNNVGAWADNDVVFYVPVRWYHQVDGKE